MMSDTLSTLASVWPQRGPQRVPKPPALVAFEKQGLPSGRSPAEEADIEMLRMLALFRLLYRVVVPYLLYQEWAAGPSNSKARISRDAVISRMEQTPLLTLSDVPNAYSALLRDKIAKQSPIIAPFLQALDRFIEAIDYHYAGQNTEPSRRKALGYLAGQVIPLAQTYDNSFEVFIPLVDTIAAPEFGASYEKVAVSGLLESLAAALGLVINLAGTSGEPHREMVRLKAVTEWLQGKAGQVARRLLRGSPLLQAEITPSTLLSWASLPAAADASEILSTISGAMSAVESTYYGTGHKTQAVCLAIETLLRDGPACGVDEEALLDEGTDLIADLMVIR